MVIVRLGSKNDLDSIESIVKEVVHDMNNIDGNYQWCGNHNFKFYLYFLNEFY